MFIRLAARIIERLKMSKLKKQKNFRPLSATIKVDQTTKALVYMRMGFGMQIVPKMLRLVSVTRKNCQMSIKVAQNDFTRKMNDFDTFTKIA